MMMMMMMVMMMGRVWRWQEAQTVTGETRSKKPSLPGELLTASVHKHLHHDHHHHHHHYHHHQYHHHLHHDHHYHHNPGVTITTTNEDAGSSGIQGKAKVSQNDRHVPQRLNLTVLPLQSLLSRWWGGGGWAIFLYGADKVSEICIRFDQVMWQTSIFGLLVVCLACLWFGCQYLYLYLLKMLNLFAHFCEEE